MELEQVKQAIESTPKGSNIIIEWVRDAKVRKGVTESIIQKAVRMVGRIGIEYDNIKDVKIGRAIGELPPTNKGLPWGKFKIYPYLIEHNGTHYLRFYKSTSKRIKPKSIFFVDGVETPKDEIKHLLLKSELDKDETEAKPEINCMNVKTKSITRLNAEIMQETLVEQERVEVEEGVAEPV